MKDKLIELFKTVDHFAATTDIWTRSNQSFIAVSVHFYTPDLKLSSSFLACEHFPGRHTNDQVAEKFNEIFNRYGILEKVFFITTDGAGEYKAALKNYGDNYRSIEMLTNDLELEWVLPPAPGDVVDEIDDFEVDEEEDNYIRIRDGDIADDDDDASRASPSDQDEESFVICQDVPLLKNMNRVACSSHLLDKVGKIDSMNACKDAIYNAKFEQTFEKITKLWSTKDSRVSAEIFKRITGQKLIGPHRIRWMQTFDAVSCICFYFVPRSHLPRSSLFLNIIGSNCSKLFIVGSSNCQFQMIQ